MNYTIMFLTDERVSRSISWDTGLEPAKKYALGHLTVRNDDRVEVLDEAGAIVFKHSTILMI